MQYGFYLFFYSWVFLIQYLEHFCWKSKDTRQKRQCCWCLYLRLEHGAAVHRVGRRSPLPLLPFALNFCNQRITSCKAETFSSISTQKEEPRGSLTFQVVVCYKTQRHHEGQFLEERNSFIIRTCQWHWARHLSVASLRYTPLGYPLSWFWGEETTEEWRRRGGWQRPSALLHLLI